MPKSVVWNGDKFLQILKAELKRRIYACVIAIQNHAKKLLGVEGTAQAIKKHSYHYGGKKRTANRKGLVYGAVVSAPGESPRKQFGRLQAGQASEVSENNGQPAGRAGTNVKYARPLELGASGTRDTVFGKKVKPFKWRILARPFLRRSLKELATFIRAVLAKPMKF